MTTIRSLLRSLELPALAAACVAGVLGASLLLARCDAPDLEEASEPAPNAVSPANVRLLGPSPEEVARRLGSEGAVRKYGKDGLR